MINEYPAVPEHLQARWDEANTELAISSAEVNEANRRHLTAIMARIALNEELRVWQQNNHR